MYHKMLVRALQSGVSVPKCDRKMAEMTVAELYVRAIGRFRGLRVALVALGCHNMCRYSQSCTGTCRCCHMDDHCPGMYLGGISTECRRKAWAEKVREVEEFSLIVS